MPLLPEEKARVKIDKQLRNAGWDIVARNEYLPNSTSAVKEALMGGNTESDYLLFIDGKAIAVVEAKREENPLGSSLPGCVHFLTIPITFKRIFLPHIRIRFVSV